MYESLEWLGNDIFYLFDLFHFTVSGQVKRASELRTGVLTQCIKSRTLERINPMTVTNILLKVNAKLRGTNHCIAPTFTLVLDPWIIFRTYILILIYLVIYFILFSYILLLRLNWRIISGLAYWLDRACLLELMLLIQHLDLELKILHRLLPYVSLISSNWMIIYIYYPFHSYLILIFLIYLPIL